MKLLSTASILVGLFLSGCYNSEVPPQPNPPATPEGANTATSNAAGLPTLTPIRGTGELTASDEDGFTFVIFGDNRPAQGEPQPETIKEIFTEIKELQPAFAMSLGDIIEGKPQPDDPQAIDTIRGQFKDFLALAKTAATPIYNAPGNHEMDDVDDIPTQRMHELYHECVGPSYGAFNYGNSRFIALNTEDVPPADAPKPPADAEFSYMSPQQIAELKADLDANRDKKHIFITMHYPIHAKEAGPPDSKWDDRLYAPSRKALLDLFKNYDNIAYIMAAHEHLYFNPAAPENVTDVPGWQPGDPIVYLVSGGAGAPLNEGKWGFHHYLVFKVRGDQVSVELVKLQGTGSSS